MFFVIPEMPSKTFIMLKQNNFLIFLRINLRVGQIPLQNISNFILYFNQVYRKEILNLFLLGSGLGSLDLGQRLLGPDDDGGTDESGLGEILPVSLLLHGGLHLQRK